MSIASTVTKACTQTPGNNPSQWFHNWSCTYHQPQQTGVGSAGYATGHNALPIIIIGMLIGLVLIAMSKSRGRSAAATR